MLRNKEPELAEKIDSSFGCFDLGIYRVNFVFGSRHLIIVCCGAVWNTTDYIFSPHLRSKVFLFFCVTNRSFRRQQHRRVGGSKKQ